MEVKVTVSTLALSPKVTLPLNVDIPVTRRSLVVVRPVTPNVAMVAIPITSRSLVVVRPVTPNVAMVAIPITSRSLVVVRPVTPNVAMVAIPVTFKLVKSVLVILIRSAVKIPT